ncbi:putative amidohydrolase [Spinactinospora alkalitolerans]|uniref:Putative amidohydrolase n=1 Tax=Spinactinospora alkalitolerans TaxID=687207 RepID=A0A852TVG8_9ACTN|nr:carbon-nitrogen hydrolase family protein [Spinactinospora alkalitolerans]NYE46084.1 putative amidohydrolase [Spinactinospora alkalitolerans]
MSEARTTGGVLRVALHQGSAHSADVPENLRLLADAARRAARQGARLLVCPEMSLTGYNIGDGVARSAEPADGPMRRAVSAIAAEAGIAVLYGFPERDGPRVHNAVQLVDARGRAAARYRKTHLFGDIDRRAFAAGDTAVVQATVDGVRVGLLICYDVEFPETVRAHALAGTELLLVPTALMRPYEAVARTLVPARAIESQIHVAYVNRRDREGELDYCGLSCLIGPDGTELARAGGDDELVVADVDAERLSAARREIGYLADRRPELYGSLADPR